MIPADNSIYPGIVELKRVPKCAHLVVGRNSFGEFSLWYVGFNYSEGVFILSSFHLF